MYALTPNKNLQRGTSSNPQEKTKGGTIRQPLHSSLRQDIKNEKEGKLNRSWSPSQRREQPKQIAKPAGVSLLSKLKNWTTNLFQRTNINYTLANQAHNMQESLVVTILGQVFFAEKDAEIKKRMSEIIWFSYREKIPKILETQFPKGAYTCDRGWGCMLRCGQMMMAEAIKRHCLDNDIFISGLNETALLEVILLFADAIKDPRISPFSIHQICSKAYEYFDLKPGEWFKPSNIMVTLAKLNEEHVPSKLRNFKTCIFVDGTVFEDQIIEKAYNRQINYENNHHNIESSSPILEEKSPDHEKEDDLDSEKNNGNLQANEGKEISADIQEEQKIEKQQSSNEKKPETNQETKNLEQDKWDSSLLIFVATKTGLDEHNELYLHTILKLLSFKQSIGMLGGKGSRAYYFLGFQNSTLLYYDPHYVQDASADIASLEKDFHTYFLKKCFQISVKDIDTSVGFGFYIKDEEDYLDFKQSLQNALNEDTNFLVGFEKLTPPLDLDPEDVIICKEDESFEIIS